jgi:L-asparaginase/Glu-tRNA(Gln) amidotransferase subunit D
MLLDGVLEVRFVYTGFKQEETGDVRYNYVHPFPTMVERFDRSRIESNEEAVPTPTNFFKLGGTWDMVFRDGRKIGSGTLDDDALKQIETRLGCFDRQRRDRAERALATELYGRFQQASREPLSTAEHLSSWATNEKGEQFGTFASGPFIPLFSGDSSHLRNSIVAPMIAVLIERAIQEPTKPILGGQGTDTADIALLGLFDVLTFDTRLPPLILAGANRSHREPDTDAPRNFLDLARLTRVDLDPGAYWAFQGNLYRASDVVKIDPEESRRVEDQSTFLAAHKTNESIDTVLDPRNRIRADWGSRSAPSAGHVVHRVTTEALYRAFQAIRTHDLGDQNPSGLPDEYLDNPSIKAIIVAAHSLGNVDDITRYDLVEAAKRGKIVIGASRTLIGATSDAYSASLLTANYERTELAGTSKAIVSARKLNKAIARAVAARALLEGLDQSQTQDLLDNYARSRKLM